jgi:hypothetical protein
MLHCSAAGFQLLFANPGTVHFVGVDVFELVLNESTLRVESGIVDGVNAF